METNISLQKNILQLKAFSGLTAISVEQDFHATVFVSNLHSILVKHAQKTIDDTRTNGKYFMKINNNKSMGRLKTILVRLFANENPEEILNVLHGYFIRDPLPVRPNGTFPRIVKNRQTKSKYKTFTNYKTAD